MSAPIPRKPGSLDRVGGILWRSTIETLQSQDTYSDADLPLVERYVLALQMARQLRADVEDIKRRATAREVDHNGDPVSLYVTGSTGNLVGHPAVKMAREAEADAHRYAVELLLTPASRARAKIGQGGDDADDGLDGILDGAD